MKNMQLVIPCLFLPKDITAGLQLPALRTCLARARAEPLSVVTLEQWLCEEFGVAGDGVAPVTLLADGVAPESAYWLRADPVHLHLLHDRVILRPDVTLTPDEARQLITALNAHFDADGLRFSAPHPQHWYLRLDAAPDITTQWLSEVDGADVRPCLPQGADALRWHRYLNEAQMLLHAHPLNVAREERGALAVNSVWLWGGGTAGVLRKPDVTLCGDSELARAFATAAGVKAMTLEQGMAQAGDVLYISGDLQRTARRGDLIAWRADVEMLERICIAPLLKLLQAGKLEQLTLDVPQAGAARRFVLRKSDLWKVWRKGVAL